MLQKFNFMRMGRAFLSGGLSHVRAHRCTPLRPSPFNGHSRTHSAVAARLIEDDVSGPAAQGEGSLLLSSLRHRVGFIGAGQMGEAMIKGFIAMGLPRTSITASVKTAKRKEYLEGELGIQAADDAVSDGGAAQIAQQSDVIILAVKPIYMGPVLDALAAHIQRDHVIVTVAAGIQLKTYESHFPAGTRVIRAMPNTPSTIGRGATGYCLGKHATRADGELVQRLMSSIGLAVEVEESQMDALTALSGSGPAYVFMMIEALADGGVAAGLPRDKALALAAQTVAGAASMVQLASGDGSLTHPGVLKDKVASPGGTTIAGLAALEDRAVRGAFISAVKAAAQRSREMGQ